MHPLHRAWKRRCATSAGQPNAVKIGYPRVHGYLANGGEDIGNLCCLDTHRKRDLQMQPSTVDVGLDFMALGEVSAQAKAVLKSAAPISTVKGKKRTCWAKSKSDLVATKSVGI